ncbi:hypothetical protein CCACVL1_00672 [Corchorus capsularis]|uniref:Uncharacterized protein n=1 Tax=Corchorus capsularis TaxID=210143 RepID=A0A1R3KVB9_COCAP|nr:hypothetical protein CCACVL1_01378 [Corchorus capsularis]OMP07183.1 hypothetical protein CCACVL1_01358 [Corchorus capsularis]OMP07208.1 hypothetical protein CCACVL1_01349 [Corchorus capsularis]OMP07212.1 hypothetical protein CCACVL1_01347 [Corchorus capsularis]OMP07213.1 hypothetical protein CCACVL1_01346 [Corchorus capsularis]
MVQDMPYPPGVEAPVVEPVGEIGSPDEIESER